MIAVARVAALTAEGDVTGAGCRQGGTVGQGETGEVAATAAESFEEDGTGARGAQAGAVEGDLLGGESGIGVCGESGVGAIEEDAIEAVAAIDGDGSGETGERTESDGVVSVAGVDDDIIEEARGEADLVEAGLGGAVGEGAEDVVGIADDEFAGVGIDVVEGQVSVLDGNGDFAANQIGKAALSNRVGFRFRFAHVCFAATVSFGAGVRFCLGVRFTAAATGNK